MSGTVASNTQETIAGLRALADHLEANPELTVSTFTTINAIVVKNDPAEYAAAASAMGGDRTKAATDSLMMVSRDFGGRVVLELVGNRDQVCTRRVVGTETVDVPDPTFVVPTITEVRDVYEWDCAPVLGAS